MLLSRSTMKRARSWLLEALASRFRGVATKVLRDGTLRFDGAGHRLTVRTSTRQGEFPRVEFTGNASLDHFGDARAGLDALVARYDALLMDWHPLARREYDAVRRAVTNRVQPRA